MASTPSRFSARLLLALAFSLTLACFAGCSGGQDLAAKCSAFTISEQEVTDYTASYRAQNGYTDDTDWARFLVAQGYSDTKTWREEAIRALAEQKIVENRAAELNVSADETVVDQTIAYVRQLRGITTDEEWASYLEGIGMTADEYRASCEFASVEQQVLAADLDLAANGSDDELNAYIKSNLMDRVTRRFSVITFKSEADANAALAQLEGLSGDELAARFTEVATEYGANGATLTDFGWDLNYSTDSAIDGNDKIKLQAGDLYKKVVAGDGIWQLYLCTGRFAFESGVTFDAIPDEDLKSLIESATISSLLSGEVEDYLDKKVKEADIEVYKMPSGLPYDVDSIISDISHK